MKQPKLHAGLLVAALLSISVLVVAPVRAMEETSTDDSASVSNTDASTTGADKRAAVQDRVSKLRADAKAKAAEMREGKQEKTAEKLQKVCENREKAVNNKLKAFNNAADKHLTRLNGVFDKLQSFQAEQQRDVANYDELVATANEKKQAATDAVTALKELAVDIDCTSTDPASSLGAVKTAAKDAREALKEYRKSLKDIVVALAQADKTTETDTTDTSEGGAE